MCADADTDTAYGYGKSNRYMYRFDLPYPYAVSVSASAHIESLLCVYTITMFCRIPHAASACRIRTYGILALSCDKLSPTPAVWVTVEHNAE